MLLFFRVTATGNFRAYFHPLRENYFPEIVVITGFNTDIEFDNVVYHVQTEDKGLETPLILSLVYVGGAILASKRSPYHDLISMGFDPVVLGERLQRQHTLICAAVKAGRIEDLKRLSQRDAGEQNKPPLSVVAADVAAEVVAQVQAITPPVSSSVAETDGPEIIESAPEPDILVLDTASTSTEQTIPARLVGKQNDDYIQVEAEDALHLSLLEERDFHAGEVVTIRIRVSRGGGDVRIAAVDVPVTVKILGTEFRPLILTTRSDRDGVATVHAWLPRFTKGRAAVLVRAAVDGFTAELRRIIHQR
jgi:hypothetical protein